MHMRGGNGTLAGMPNDPTPPTSPARDLVLKLLANHNLSANAFARMSGITQSSVSRLLDGKAEQLSADNLEKLTRAFPEIILPRDLQQIVDRKIGSRKNEAMGVTTKVLPPIDVWGTHPVHRDGEFRLNGANPMQRLTRPQNMQASHKTIAFFAPDDTMAPRWSAGEPVFVDFGRAGALGEIVLVTMSAGPEEPNETETHLLRRYDSRRDGAILVTELASGAQTAIPLARLLEVRHVLTWREFFA